MTESDRRPLSLPNPQEIARQLEREAAPDGDALAAEAEAWVARVLEASAREQQRRAVDELGLEAQRRAAHQSEMLKTPLRTLARHSEDGGPVAQALTGLRERMQDLDPQAHQLEPRRFDWLLNRLPGVSSRLQRYFRRFENAQEAIDGIIDELQAGRDVLYRDNLTLGDDQESLEQTLGELNHQLALGQAIEARLQATLDEQEPEAAERAFIEQELGFPLRQRLLDLQQQVAVCQQGILALEVIIRNNRELMRGVERAINVTVAALGVAVTVALALANQRMVLDRVEGLNATTSEMISRTAKTLRAQGVDIQTRAASAMLDMQALEEAFGEVMAAIDDLADYRRQALPALGEQIERLDVLTRRGQAAVDDLVGDRPTNDEGAT
ncbi:toxic anion resistance protein [Halomonas salifodinae]|uniref:toxic anion resistance protein n=1 Tax=Halomonas salifodinae TaxID=438745 RepID=UPI0033B434F8